MSAPAPSAPRFLRSLATRARPDRLRTSARLPTYHDPLLLTPPATLTVWFDVLIFIVIMINTLMMASMNMREVNRSEPSTDAFEAASTILYTLEVTS